jgi:hypothetical protein
MQKTTSKIEVANVTAHAFKPELDSAELRQTITSTYPTRQANSEGLFSESEYGLAGKNYDSVRVCWIDVPKGTTVQQVQARVDAMPAARIKRIMSLKPILSAAQEAAIQKGLTTLDKIAAAQTVKRADGTIVLYDEKYTQYKKNQASWLGEPDVDLRPALTTAVEAEVIIAEEIAKATPTA